MSVLKSLLFVSLFLGAFLRTDLLVAQKISYSSQIILEESEDITGLKTATLQLVKIPEGNYRASPNQVGITLEGFRPLIAPPITLKKDQSLDLRVIAKSQFYSQYFLYNSERNKKSFLIGKDITSAFMMNNKPIIDSFFYAYFYNYWAASQSGETFLELTGDCWTKHKGFFGILYPTYPVVLRIPIIVTE